MIGQSWNTCYFSDKRTNINGWNVALESKDEFKNLVFYFLFFSFSLFTYFQVLSGILKCQWIWGFINYRLPGIFVYAATLRNGLPRECFLDYCNVKLFKPNSTVIYLLTYPYNLHFLLPPLKSMQQAHSVTFYPR